MGRKTFEVENFINTCNTMLRSKMSQEEKSVVCTLLEDVLHKTGNYKGFSYNYWDKQGFREWLQDGKPDFPEKAKYIGPEYDRTYYQKDKSGRTTLIVPSNTSLR